MSAPFLCGVSFISMGMSFRYAVYPVPLRSHLRSGKFLWHPDCHNSIQIHCSGKYPTTLMIGAVSTDFCAAWGRK